MTTCRYYYFFPNRHFPTFPGDASSYTYLIMYDKRLRVVADDERNFHSLCFYYGSKLLNFKLFIQLNRSSCRRSPNIHNNILIVYSSTNQPGNHAYISTYAHFRILLDGVFVGNYVYNNVTLYKGCYFSYFFFLNNNNCSPKLSIFFYSKYIISFDP